MWLLTKIAMKNFKPYQSEVEININLEHMVQGKHIIVVYGDNGFGKTSLLDAIYWALYGKMERNTALMFNDRASDPEMYVELYFFDPGENSSLLIRRSATKWKHNERIEIIKNGTAVKGDPLDLQQMIEDEILPREISKFFFFDAEDIKNIAKQQGGEYVKDSVELILGLKPIRKTLDDLDSLRRSFENERKNAMADVEKLREFKESLEKIDKELSEKEKQKKEVESKLQEKQEILKQLRAKLAESTVKEVKNLEFRRKQLENKKESLEKERNSLEKRLSDLSNSIHLLILQSILEDKIGEVKDKLKDLKREKTKFDESDRYIYMLDKLVSESKCPICGKLALSSEISIYQDKLEKLQKKNQNLEKYKKEIEDTYASFRMIYLRLSKQLDKIRGLDYKEIFRICQRIQEINNELHTLHKDLEKLSNTLQSMGIAVVSQLEQQITSLADEIGKDKQRKEYYDNEVKKLIASKKNIERKIKILSAKGSPTYIIEQKIRIVDNLKVALGEYLNELIEMRRKDLIEEATKIFLELTNKKEEYIGFEFSGKNDYKFQIICKDGSKPNMDTISYGELEVVALSFILGLNKYSHMKAPIITDTLFGRLSPYVQENLAKFFEKMNIQLILLVLKDSRENGKTEIDDIAPIFQKKICDEFLILRDQKNRVSTLIKGKIFGGE